MLDLENLPKHTYLKVEKDFRERLFRLLNKRHSHRKLDKLLKCDTCRVKTGKNLWRSDSFIKSCNLVGLELLDVENFIDGFKIGRRGNIVRYSVLKQQSENMAELVGHAMGDGSISTMSHVFGYWNKDLTLFNHVCDILKETFGKDVKLWIRKNKETKVLEVITSSSVGHVISLYGGPIGKKVHTPFFVSDWILNGTSGIKRAFVRALFDDEGCVINMIHLSMMKNEKLKEGFEKFLNQIKRLLLDLGIDRVTVKIHPENEDKVKGYIYISGRKNLRFFHQNIGFLQSKRSERLKISLENYKLQVYRPGEGREIILDLFKKHKTLTTGELSKILKRTKSRILVILYELENKGLIKRCGRLYRSGIKWCMS